VFSEAGPDSGLTKLDVNDMGVPDESLSTVLGTAHYADIRRKAIEVHRTQYWPLDRRPTPELEAGLLN